MNPHAADKRFFDALVVGDAQALDHILTDDFILIDVMSGSEITKPAFLAAIGSGQIKFEAIEPADNRVRHYQTPPEFHRAGSVRFRAASRLIRAMLAEDGPH